MFKGYAELQALAPQEYLNWRQFETPFDTYHENVARGLADEQYQHGLDIGREYDQIHISCNGVWGATKQPADPKRSGVVHCQSCEGIGYHACTKDLLHGFLDSGTPIVVYRYGQQPVQITD